MSLVDSGLNKIQDNILKKGDKRETIKVDVCIPVTWLFCADGSIRWSFLRKLISVYASVTIIIFFFSVLNGLDHSFDVRTTITTEYGSTTESSIFYGSYFEYVEELGRQDYKAMLDVFVVSLKYLPIALEDSIALQTGTVSNLYYSAQRVLIDFNIYIPNVPILGKDIRSEMEGSNFFWMMNVFRVIFFGFIILSFYQKHCQKKLNIAVLSKYYIPLIFLFKFYNRKDDLYCYSKLVNVNSNKALGMRQVAPTTKSLFGISSVIYNDVITKQVGNLEIDERQFSFLGIEYNYEFMYVLGYKNSPIVDKDTINTKVVNNSVSSGDSSLEGLNSFDLEDLVDEIEDLEDDKVDLEDDLDELTSDNVSTSSENTDLREDLEKFTKY